MSVFPQPWQLFVAILAEWVRKEQEKRIEFLKLEIGMLLKQSDDKRVLLTDEQRRVLAVKRMTLSREDLDKRSTIVQANTIRRWHRELVVGNRLANAKQKTGRPRTDPEVVELVLRMARENVSWGYKRIEGALDHLGFQICSSTIASILKQHGIEPAPERARQLSWSTFLKAHLDAFESVDFHAPFTQLAGLFARLPTLAGFIWRAWPDSYIHSKQSRLTSFVRAARTASIGRSEWRSHNLKWRSPSSRGWASQGWMSFPVKMYRHTLEGKRITEG